MFVVAIYFGTLQSSIHQNQNKSIKILVNRKVTAKYSQYCQIDNKILKYIQYAKIPWYEILVMSPTSNAKAAWSFVANSVFGCMICCFCNVLLVFSTRIFFFTVVFYEQKNCVTAIIHTSGLKNPKMCLLLSLSICPQLGHLSSSFISLSPSSVLWSIFVNSQNCKFPKISTKIPTKFPTAYMRISGATTYAILFFWRFVQQVFKTCKNKTGF